jgi:hypothetical protein
MALLQEEATFSHVIAIDFGTGASGYYPHIDMALLIKLKMKKVKNQSSKYLILVTKQMTKKQQPQSYSTTTKNS